MSVSTGELYHPPESALGRISSCTNAVSGDNLKRLCSPKLLIMLTDATQIMIKFTKSTY